MSIHLKRKKNPIRQCTKQKNPHVTTLRKQRRVIKRQIIEKKRTVIERQDRIKRLKKDPPGQQEELMRDLFSISDSNLSSDDEDENDEHHNKLFILPHLADYLVNNPDQSPESYLTKHYHRLSEQYLYYPIESLLIPPVDMCDQRLREGIYITVHEFEALQGLGRFMVECQK